MKKRTAGYRGKLFRLEERFLRSSRQKFQFALALGEPRESGEVECIGVCEPNGKTTEKMIPLTGKDIIEEELPADLVLLLEKKFSLSKDEINHVMAKVYGDCLKKVLRQHTLICAEKYYEAKHKRNRETFNLGERIPYAARIFDEKENTALVDSALDFWLTTGRYTPLFEPAFANFSGVRYCSLPNSGSSANLLAFMALTSPKLGYGKICRGDEVITVASGFPTTVASILQYGAVPVFVDISLPTYNIDCDQLEVGPSEKTKAIMIAHTLGNPFDLRKFKEFCDQHNLWLIEDDCDALGAKYLYNGEWKYTGIIGHMATSSFYPPNHITMDEGGAVNTNDPQLKRLVESFRDWGRDCWCPTGHDNTCTHRFKQQFGKLPSAYDHKYVYLHFGYNLKVTEMQAAIGWAQLKKLKSFVAARRHNWQYLYERLKDLKDQFVLPEATVNSDPSWFGFS